MTVQFFPRQKQFWLYHGLGLAAFVLVNIGTLFLRPQPTFANLIASLLLLPILFTFAVLGFRWLRKTNRFFNASTTKLIPLVIIYAIITAFIVVTIMAATLMPFFWQDIVNAMQLAGNYKSPLQVIYTSIIGGTISVGLLVVLWVFMYVSIIENRQKKQTELTNLRLQNSLKEAKLSSLTNQLKPHFIFNALNNVRFMIHENPGHADNMITALSDILRYSLTSGEKEKVTLSEELEVTQRYIDIVKLQYEDKLQFTKNISSDVMHYLIPPMSIQILVENAIKHGLEHIKSGCELSINLEQTATQITITVKNPMPTSTIENNANSTGSGLKNIRKRLQLLYGDNAELLTDQDALEYVAILTLPKEAY